MDGRGKTRKTGEGIEEIIYCSFKPVMKLKKSTNIILTYISSGDGDG